MYFTAASNCFFFLDNIYCICIMSLAYVLAVSLIFDSCRELWSSPAVNLGHNFVISFRTLITRTEGSIANFITAFVLSVNGSIAPNFCLLSKPFADQITRSY